MQELTHKLRVIKIGVFFTFIYFWFFIFEFFNAIKTAKILESNYYWIKKKSKTSDYKDKIIFLASSKHKLQKYHDSNFGLTFQSIIIRKRAYCCYVSRSDDSSDDNYWYETDNTSPAYPYRENSSYRQYTQYLDFTIGNYIVNSGSFNNIETTKYILSENEIDSFSKSPASKDFIYLGDGYFFDKHFSNNKNLFRRFHFCSDKDLYVAFEIYNPKSISILGIVNDGIISHIDFLGYDYSKIYDKKMKPDQIFFDTIFQEKSRIFITLLVIIFLLFLLNHYQTSFAIFSVIFLTLTVLFECSCILDNFPIKPLYFFSFLLIILIYLIKRYDREFWIDLLL